MNLREFTWLSSLDVNMEHCFGELCLLATLKYIGVSITTRIPDSGPDPEIVAGDLVRC